MTIVLSISSQGMLAGQRLKATGSKPKLVKRLVKYYVRKARDEEFALSKLEGRLGPIQSGTDSISNIVRKFYTKNYSALDRFDRYWYDLVYPSYNKDWNTYFTFCLLHQAVINSFVAYCKLKDEKMKVKDYVALVLDEFERSIESS